MERTPNTTDISEKDSKTTESKKTSKKKAESFKKAQIRLILTTIIPIGSIPPPLRI